MSLVVDSSIAIKWYVQETWHEEALEIADREVDLLAPDFIVAEVTNVAWKKALRGEITQQQAIDIAARIGSGTPGLCESSLLNEEALRIGLAISHPVYDCPWWRTYRKSEPP
jgi:predicted nucleic acid-binding protein